MSLFIGFLISVGICLLALWLLPSPKYGQLRGCTAGRCKRFWNRKSATKKDASGRSAPHKKRENPLHYERVLFA